MYKKCVLLSFGVASVSITEPPQCTGSLNLLLIALISVSVSLWVRHPGRRARGGEGGLLESYMVTMWPSTVDGCHQKGNQGHRAPKLNLKGSLMMLKLSTPCSWPIWLGQALGLKKVRHIQSAWRKCVSFKTLIEEFHVAESGEGSGTERLVWKTGSRKETWLL